MSRKIADDIVIREKRQVTLPRDICAQLGIEPGDRLTLYVEGDQLIARPKKTIALDALRELQQLFKDSGITEQDLIKTSRRVRRTLVKRQYGIKA